MKFKILSRDEIWRAVSMRDAIRVVKEGFVQFSKGKAAVPLRTSLAVERHSGTTLFMPAYLSRSGALGAKIVSVFPKNKKLHLPVIQAMVVLINPKTGEPLAAMDGTYLTALRTGAASGLATDLLSRKDSRVASVIGAGTQGRTQLEAICTLRILEKIWVYDADPAAARAFKKEMKTRGLPIPEDIRLAKTPAEAVRESDIICTATTSSKPVFSDADLKPGTHINAVGSYKPEMQEIPAETVGRAKIIVDSRAACLAEAGDIIIPLRRGLISEGNIHAEIGEVAAAAVPGRESAGELTLFKSVGLAVQDMAVAHLVYRAAQERGLGTDLDL
jgi:ornithine cyclodeaminase